MLKPVKVKENFKSDSGMATIEMIPIIVVVMMLVNFTLGFFGVIHAGILQSIAARNYTFETLRNRSNLTYFRDADDSNLEPYRNGFRFHGVVETNETSDGFTWYVTRLPIRFTDINGIYDERENIKTHEAEIINIQDGGKVSLATGEGVNPVWIKTLYGICINSKCGGK